MSQICHNFKNERIAGGFDRLRDCTFIYLISNGYADWKRVWRASPNW